MRTLVVLCVAVLSAGCQTTPQSGSSVAQKPQLNEFERNCVSFGLKPNTIPFNECVRKSAEALKKPTTETRKRVILTNIGNNLGGGS